MLSNEVSVQVYFLMRSVSRYAFKRGQCPGMLSNEVSVQLCLCMILSTCASPLKSPQDSSVAETIG